MAWSNLVAAINTKFGRRGEEEYLDDDEFLDEDEYEEEYEEEKPARKSSKGWGKISPFNSSSKKTEAPAPRASHEVFAIMPESINDARTITDKLIEGITVVLNTEKCSPSLASRIFDYTLGTVYALNCAFGRISYSADNSPVGIYIITPEDTSINGAFQDNFLSEDVQ